MGYFQKCYRDLEINPWSKAYGTFRFGGEGAFWPLLKFSPYSCQIWAFGQNFRYSIGDTINVHLVSTRILPLFDKKLPDVSPVKGGGFPNCVGISRWDHFQLDVLRHFCPKVYCIFVRKCLIFCPNGRMQPSPQLVRLRYRLVHQSMINSDS